MTKLKLNEKGKIARKGFYCSVCDKVYFIKENETEVLERRKHIKEHKLSGDLK